MNFNLMSLKFLGNIFLTDDGYDVMQDKDKCVQLMTYCMKSMTSANDIVVKVAIQVLTNYIIDISGIKVALNDHIQKAMSQLDRFLVAKMNAQTLDTDAIKEILKCQC